jgi:hypothetical protein
VDFNILRIMGRQNNAGQTALTEGLSSPLRSLGAFINLNAGKGI